MIAYAKTHIFYIILIVVGVIAFRSWLQEHDSRMLAESVVKQQESQVADLKQQAAQKVQVITKIVKEAVTPSQVVAAIPTLTDVPLNTRLIPNDPVDVVVAAQPLVQLAGDDKTTHIQLDTCNQVVKLKDVEIAALKKKPSFWKRALGVGKAVGVGIGIGVLLVR